MLIVTKRRYKKQHVIGGAGIFDTVVGFIKRLFTSNAAKAVASSIARGAAKQAGEHLAAKILAPPPPAAVISPVPLQTITQKSKDDLARLIHDVPVNINNLMMGNGAAALAPEAHSAALARSISIQDLVRKINGTGMKIVM